MKIRKANKKDLKQISKIYKKEHSKKPYNENWSKKSALKKVESYFKLMNILVAEINKNIVGFIMFYASLWEDGFRGEIIESAVSSEFQGKGIGGKLLKKAEDVLKKKGAKTSVLLINMKIKAFKFYKKRGYHKDGFVEVKKKLK